MGDEDIGSYGDEVLRKNITWNTENIIKILAKGNTKKVFFTRKTFKDIKDIQLEIKKVESFAKKNSIKFEYLPTPARFKNDEKLGEWKELFDL